MARRRKEARAHDSELQTLRARYHAELPGKVGAVEEAAAALREGAPASELGALYLLTHRLRGSAAIYGFADVSNAAAGLEVFVAAAVEAAAPCSGPWLDELRAHVTHLTDTLPEVER
jgi:HPt (histidine-containing phosphotransfer) domain-containing protein